MEVLMERARQAVEEATKAARTSAASMAPTSPPELLRVALERSKELAAEATRRADQIRELALDSADRVRTSLGGESGVGGSPCEQFDNRELDKYGITPELRDFVQGLTIDTFRDFPLEDDEMNSIEHAGEIEVPNTSPVLSPWQERHARLVLSAVPEISDFRYRLCPKHIKEKRFWRIYFTLVDGHIAKYEAQAAECTASKHSENAKNLSPDPDAEPSKYEAGQSSPAAETSVVRQHAPIAEVQEDGTPSAEIRKSADQDLDAYLMGELGSSEDEGLDNDDSFDAEFEQLVNDAALNSGSDDEKH